MSKANFFQTMPCKHCGYIGYHLWAGSGLCPGLTVEDQDMPESMFYYQMGFKQGYNQATSDITTKDAESHPRQPSVVCETCKSEIDKRKNVPYLPIFYYGIVMMALVPPAKGLECSHEAN